MKDPDRGDWVYRTGRSVCSLKLPSHDLQGIKLNLAVCRNKWTSYLCLLYILLLNFLKKCCGKLRYNLGVLSTYAPRGRNSGSFFCGRTLVLGRWNLQMPWCKSPGSTPGMAADKCIIFRLIILPFTGLFQRSIFY